MYGTLNLPAVLEGANSKLDLYALYLDRDNAVYRQGGGDDERYTLGGRFFANPKPFDFDVEAAYQFGDFADGESAFRLARGEFDAADYKRIGKGGKEVWIQPVGDQLLIGVDVEEGDAEFANLLLRPQATNLVGLQLEMEPADLAGDDDDHVHGPDCNH